MTPFRRASRRRPTRALYDFSPYAKARLGEVLDRPIFRNPWLRAVLALFGAAGMGILISTPLEPEAQAAVAVVFFAAALALRRVAGQVAAICLMGLSIAVSLRYMFWRLTETVGFDSLFSGLVGWSLVGAELYALAVLLLGYVQTVWPLRRKPVPLPPDPASWPTVDIYIPTYNESLNVVRMTVLAALGMDWPRDKLSVWVLDDGRRAEFRAFCEAVGAGYITRPDNKHAKAGNLNFALRQTSGEYVAIFDCDHVPTRSFLQVCLGWFLRDPKLAMLQTPHFFFSADPFERNLGTFRLVPNEGELFYGLVQDGNDLWNASFFCGSCAVLRRGPLLEVGGVAVETVTEDAHTALKLSRRGYNTAYLGIPQAAGLATDSLSVHVGQRIRWARGMAQIFRVDNPLFGPGLKLGQRLCYANAMLHFFYGLPRLIFLTAPLAYLYFGARTFQADAITIVLYALPHVAHAALTNSHLQGRFRHSFWNEVYETVLAWYIMRPALYALVNPRAGKFNVTAKGGVIESSYFDWMMARPYVALFAMNLGGMVVGLLRIFLGPPQDRTTVMLNLVWTGYNTLIAAASMAVASEVRQLRENPRVACSFPATLIRQDGHTVACSATDFSQSGVGLRSPVPMALESGERVSVALFSGGDEAVFPAEVMHARGDQVGLRFDGLDLRQQATLVQMTFARADAWLSVWGRASIDTPLTGLAEVLRAGVAGIAILTRAALGRVLLSLPVPRFGGAWPRRRLLAGRSPKPYAADASLP